MHVIAWYRRSIGKLAMASTRACWTHLTLIRWQLFVLLAKSFDQSIACARKKCYVSGCKTAVSYVTRRDRGGHLPQPCASRYAGVAMSTTRQEGFARWPRVARHGRGFLPLLRPQITPGTPPRHGTAVPIGSAHSGPNGRVGIAAR